MPQVLLHELVHIYFGIISPQRRIPSWLHEGIAQYLSHESLTMDEQVFIANALFSEKIIPLMELDSLFSFQRNQARLGYALARSAVDFFVQQYGVDKLYDLVSQFTGSRSVNKNFLSVTGRDFIDFEIRWYNYIDKEYSWVLILNSENIIWSALILLFIIAFLRIKLKNRKILSSWKEDIDEDPDV